MKKVHLGEHEEATNFEQNKLIVNEKGELIRGVAYGNNIEQTDDGVSVTRPDGTKITMLNDGDIKIENFIPKQVGISSLADVVDYKIDKVGLCSIHKIKIINDGYVELTYTESGELVNLSGQNTTNTITKENNFFIGSTKDNPQ